MTQMNLAVRSGTRITTLWRRGVEEPSNAHYQTFHIFLAGLGSRIYLGSVVARKPDHARTIVLQHPARFPEPFDPRTHVLIVRLRRQLKLKERELVDHVSRWRCGQEGRICPSCSCPEPSPHAVECGNCGDNLPERA